MNDLEKYKRLIEPNHHIKLYDDLAPVVRRISQRIPTKLMTKLFASTPEETGGEIRFPYHRMDTALIVIRDRLWLINTYNYQDEKREESYAIAARLAFTSVLWVEVGFQGLENLARSHASKNWTSGVGHTVSDEERFQGIMTNGAQFYDETLRGFTLFRKENKITEDIFSKHDLEDLLRPFQ